MEVCCPQICLAAYLLFTNLVQFEYCAMKLLLFYLAALVARLPPNSCNILQNSILSPSLMDEYRYNLQQLLGEILVAVRLEQCLAIITDEFHHTLFDQGFFRHTTALRPYYYVHVPESEDLLAPNYQTVQLLKHITAAHCDLHFIMLLNGLQVKRFLHFIHRYRLLNTRARFVLLHDVRILEEDMLYIWSNMISSIFVKRHLGNRFSILSISYPGILNGIVVTEQLMTKWHWGMHVRGVQLFPEKSANLKGAEMLVAVFAHVPMVMKNSEDNVYRGLEIEILRALADALNFRPKFYEASDSETERWGRELANGSYTGLIGQLVISILAINSYVRLIFRRHILRADFIK